jgi:mono/diheme cytochrome c family protein
MIGSIPTARNFVVPIIAAAVVAVLATLLLTIGARSPYTHANLAPRFDSAYTRTEQATVGQPVPFRGSEPASTAAVADSLGRGQALLVSHGCASCHGLAGRRGVVGPPIRGSDAEDLRAKTNKGPGGMPAYGLGALADADLEAMAAYLKSAAQ